MEDDNPCQCCYRKTAWSDLKTGTGKQKYRHPGMDGGLFYENQYPQRMLAVDSIGYPSIDPVIIISIALSV